MNFDLNFWVKPDLNTNNWIKKNVDTDQGFSFIENFWPKVV